MVKTPVIMNAVLTVYERETHKAGILEDHRYSNCHIKEQRARSAHDYDMINTKTNALR